MGGRTQGVLSAFFPDADLACIQCLGHREKQNVLRAGDRGVSVRADVQTMGGQSSLVLLLWDYWPLNRYRDPDVRVRHFDKG